MHSTTQTKVGTKISQARIDELVMKRKLLKNKANIFL
ncbi:hypothetical protein BGS_0732 [Beggiatoa sp. SS]|nr:hypothetical protein BGS_0732 [Beggiatoa sp. SS]